MLVGADGGRRGGREASRRVTYEADATELGRAEARSAVRGRGVPGGSHVRPTRTTETGSRDDRPHTGATSLQTCLVFSAPRPRPSKSPGIGWSAHSEVDQKF